MASKYTSFPFITAMILFGLALFFACVGYWLSREDERGDVAVKFTKRYRQLHNIDPPPDDDNDVEHQPDNIVTSIPISSPVPEAIPMTAFDLEKRQDVQLLFNK